MDIDRINNLVAQLALLDFFPSEPQARIALARMLGEMCESETHAEWLVRVMTCGIYDKWPGVAEMRGIYCQRFQPQDGIDGYSAVYLRGMPEQARLAGAKVIPLQLAAAPQPPSLPAGHEFSADVEMEALLRKVAARKEKPPVDHKALKEEIERIRAAQEDPAAIKRRKRVEDELRQKLGLPPAA